MYKVKYEISCPILHDSPRNFLFAFQGLLHEEHKMVDRPHNLSELHIQMSELMKI